MTHKNKACLLIILFIMICAWCAPLHAAQKHAQMTDGTFFIYNQVIGGGLTSRVDDGYTITYGTLGQSIMNIGTASDAQNLTQHAGFWHTAKGTQDSILVTFNESEERRTIESDHENIVIPLVLNSESDTSITVTIGTRLCADCDGSDYTLYKDGTAQSSTTVTLVFAPEQKVNEDLSVDIINEKIIERDNELITFYIQNIEGDAELGLYREYNLNILANDALAITGCVRYLGNQTGTLNVLAIDTETGLPAVDPVTYPWEWNTKQKDFVTYVPPGSYTITAYIDSDGLSTTVMNSWEVTGSYTPGIVVIAEDTDCEDLISIAMYDPEFRYTHQFILNSDAYQDWIAKYPEIGDPDDDFDQDGYSNIQEYINGTDPTVANEAYNYSGYDPATDIDANQIESRYQIVSTNPINPKARLGESFLVDVNYTTSDNNKGTTGLGIAVHFNSTFMSFAGFSNVLTETLAGSLENLTITAKDEGDIDTPDDGYADTDKVINIGWVSDLQGRSWPGLESPLPLRLCTLQFTIVSQAENITYGDTSVIRFSATSKDARYLFYASPSTLEINPFTFDVDGNGKANALTDGLLIMRYLFGMIVNSPTQADAIAPDATRTSSAEIWAYLNDGREMLDIDGNEVEDALTDGLLIMRYMFGLDEGDSLIENAISIDAPRQTDIEVIPYIKQYMPQKGSPVITP